jgi:hypothetical protein
MSIVDVIIDKFEEMVNALYKKQKLIHLYINTSPHHLIITLSHQLISQSSYYLYLQHPGKALYTFASALNNGVS